MKESPVYAYYQKGCLEKDIWKEGEFRKIRFQGREGLNAKSIYSRLIIRNGEKRTLMMV